jgi:hypothetical protein
MLRKINSGATKGDVNLSSMDFTSETKGKAIICLPVSSHKQQVVTSPPEQPADPQPSPSKPFVIGR